MKFEVIRPRRAAPDSQELQQFLVMLARDKQSPVAPALNMMPPTLVSSPSKQGSGSSAKSYFQGSMEPIVDFTGEFLDAPLIPQVTIVF
jgi:hypothetical protein